MHNAGFGSTELLLSTDPSAITRMLQLHCLTVASLSRALLPDMLSRERGRLVIVGSMIAHLPSPRAALYGATKAFLASFASSLSYEVGLAVDARTRGVKRSRFEPSPNVSVVLVTPGPTHTRFAEESGSERSLIFRLPLLAADAHSVASECVDGIIEGRSVIQTGALNRLTIFLVPKLPTRLANFLVYVLWGEGDWRKDFFSTAADTAAFSNAHHSDATGSSSKQE